MVPSRTATSSSPVSLAGLIPAFVLATCALLACCLLALTACSANPRSDERTGTVASPDGVPITYSTTGAGDVAVVFVHGWSCDRSYWDEQIAAVSARYRVVRVDLAGHGESGLGRQQYTMRAFGKDVAAVTDALDLRPVVLVGHSMGGTVGVEAARIVPDRVIGLIGIDTLQRPAFGLSDEQIEGFLAPFHADFSRQTDTFVRNMFPADADSVLVARIAGDMASAPPAVAISAMGELLSHDLGPALAELDLPIRCLNAERWPADLPAWAEYTGGYEVEVMSGVGHFLMLEQPAEFNRRLLTIIDAIVSAANAE
jgi:pimeloyl-ACP methyl ester carboxylesterase